VLFILLARYTKKGSDLSILHERAFSRVKTLFYLGLVRWASNYLDTGALNNWTKDEYVWEKEIVLVTGGSGGIGGCAVRLLAERGIKVVVMDVIPLTYEARTSFRCWTTKSRTDNEQRRTSTTTNATLPLHPKLQQPQLKSAKTSASPRS
jgi:hypothetical protein